MGLHPITTNVSYITTKQKKILLNKVENLFEKELEEIDNKFNEVCIDFLESTEKDNDYTIFPIYKR
jgi:hypothetical protein